MDVTDPALHLSRLTDAASTLSTSIEIADWIDAMSAEIDRLQDKGARLREAALRWPTRRKIAKANEFCAAVEPELNRAVDTLRRVRAMFFVEPPSTAMNLHDEPHRHQQNPQHRQ